MSFVHIPMASTLSRCVPLLLFLSICAPVTWLFAQVTPTANQFTLQTQDGIESVVEPISIDSESIQFRLDTGETQSYARREIARLEQFQLGDPVATAGNSLPPFVVSLVDGTQIHAVQVSFDGRQVVIAFLNPTKAPPNAEPSNLLQCDPKNLLGILWQPQNREEINAFQSMLAKNRATDEVVIRREGQLLNFEGVIDQFTSESVQFLLDGSPIPIPSAKMFGLLFTNSAKPATASIQVVDRSGNRWMATQLTASSERVELIGIGGWRVSFRFADIQTIDFTPGQQVYLSELEPKFFQQTPILLNIWEANRNRTLSDRPLRLGVQTYSKGLALRPQTFLEFQIDRQFRQFQAIAGIPEEAGPHGNLELRVLGDNKLLQTVQINANTKPLPLNIPVDQVAVLRLEVLEGDKLDIGDQLLLVNARVRK